MENDTDVQRRLIWVTVNMTPHGPVKGTMWHSDYNHFCMNTASPPSILNFILIKLIKTVWFNSPEKSFKWTLCWDCLKLYIITVKKKRTFSWLFYSPVYNKIANCLFPVWKFFAILWRMMVSFRGGIDLCWDRTLKRGRIFLTLNFNQSLAKFKNVAHCQLILHYE